MIHLVPFLVPVVRVPRIEVVVTGLVLVLSAEVIGVALRVLLGPVELLTLTIVVIAVVKGGVTVRVPISRPFKSLMPIVGQVSVLVVARGMAIVGEELSLLVDEVMIVEQVVFVVILGSLLRALLLATCATHEIVLLSAPIVVAVVVFVLIAIVQ